MPLFQQSVVKKYLNDLDKETLQQRWTAFASHFHNSTIQQNILNAKEEEYQEGFVRDLFVTVLGYILNPQPDYNFVLEKKTEADSTKSDGAILQGGKVVGVIELKDTATTDLDKVEKQAFGYKHRHPDCTYIITANFQKLRFYINDAIEYEEFDLFNLTEERFALLYLCLSEQTILKNIPLLIKKASLTQEEAVTKKLYSDYSGFRKKLFHNIAGLNQQYSKIELFQKTQKLLDRFLFILFAEDRMLLPPNSVREILKQWQQLKELDAEVPLYDRFKKYFGYLNTGHEGKQHTIFAYNGGLFAADEILDTIKIDDTILYDSCFALSNYDFQTEIDVNILGHIFEHSLNEIEELQAEAEGKPLDKAKTKRKKDGVFYTPRYITKYIVANTVGALCEQKKQELSINEEIFAYRKRKDKKRETLVKLLDEYRHWLLQLTICDPACGSGAFLNQALEYLIAEHRYIDELKANLFGDAFVLTDLDNEILENNLFGVDINEEATDIARLSLWMRTAKKDRKLSKLNDHIQCGNSLIDDPAVAGDKAFNWQKAFPKIFDVSLSSSKAGFDVVIGNPPYVDVKNLPNDIIKYLFSKYSTTENRINLYSIFIEKGLELLSSKGFLSFINPNSMLVGSSYKKLRELLISSLNQIIKLPDNVFSDAKVETMIFVLQKKSIYTSVDVLSYQKDEKISSIDSEKFKSIKKSDWIKDASLNFNLYLSDSTGKIISKVEIESSPLIDHCEFSLGITPYDKYKGHSEEDINNRVFHSVSKLDDSYKPLIAGENIVRYYTLPHIHEYIKYGDWLGRPREERFFNQERIIARQIVSGVPPRIYSSYANEPYYFTHHGFGLIPKEELSVKYLLTVINSRLINYYHTYKFLDIEKRLFQKFLIENCKKLPIKVIDKEQQLPFIAKADIMLAKNKELQELKQQLLQLLQSNFPEMQVSKKLEQWPSLSFAELLKELGKQKIKPTLPQQQEWMNYFEQQKTKALGLQTIIDTTDKEIDAMVYALYGLTNEEIQIVEDNG